MSNSQTLPQILSREQHHKIINKTNQSNNIPILILVTSSTPRSNTLRSQISELSTSDEYADAGIQWYEMPMIAETTDLIKFGVQNAPVVILMKGIWAETLLGVRGLEDVKGGIRRMIDAGR